jgi:hypothetical protein
MPDARSAAIDGRESTGGATELDGGLRDVAGNA